MTSQPPWRDTVSPYLLMKLREAPKPRLQESQPQAKEVHAEATAVDGVDSTAAASPTSSHVPPLARPGIKI